MSTDTALEAIARRDRWIVAGALTAAVVISWAYLLHGAGMDMSALEMTRMARGGSAGRTALAPMMTPATWTVGYAVLMVLMWWIMMLAMMLPSAAPMVLLFAAVNRRQRESGGPYVATAVFVGGYLAAWGGFSLIAVSLQWMLEHNGLLSPILVGRNAMFGGTVLLAAGVYQLTPLKHACLGHCRSPHAFLGAHWRPAARGALRMGLDHGTYCVGCCWLLMALLFFGGVMNLYWIMGLTVFVLLEKTLPAGHWLGYASGLTLIVWGAAIYALSG